MQIDKQLFKNIKSSPFGETDIDLEHQSRKSKDPPPRIIQPYQLQPYGFHLPHLGHIYALMTGVIKGSDSFDVLKAWFCNPVVFNPYRENYGHSGEKLWTPHGSVFLHIDIAPGKPIKRVKWANKMPKIWSYHFFGIFSELLEVYATEIFPFHINFIIKDSQVYHTPFKYMEVFMTSQNSSRGNILADYSLNDVGNYSHLHVERKSSGY